MLNAIGNAQYNNLPVLFFNLPESQPITAYSYRANESMSPVDYKEALHAINKPLLVVIGSNDEAFDAKRTTSAVIENSNGEAYVIENATHNGIRHNKKTMEVISDWANKQKLQ